MFYYTFHNVNENKILCGNLVYDKRWRENWFDDKCLRMARGFIIKQIAKVRFVRWHLTLCLSSSVLHIQPSFDDCG